MTARTARRTRSGFCEAAPKTPKPDESHARCRLEGCDCDCHTPPPRPKVPLACLQGRHTSECGHGEADPHAWPASSLEALEDGLKPAGHQLGIPVAVDPTLEPDTVKVYAGDKVAATIRGYITDHDIAEGAGFARPLQRAVVLTPEERRRIVAGHMVLDPTRPDGILEAVRAIVQERLNR